MFSCSLWAPDGHLPLLAPMLSISSINIIAFPACFALLNRSLTLRVPAPTNISINSGPDAEKNGTCASQATALARSVFPEPGAPCKSTHLGTLAPTLWYFCGFLR